MPNQDHFLPPKPAAPPIPAVSDRGADRQLFPVKPMMWVWPEGTRSFAPEDVRKCRSHKENYPGLPDFGGFCSPVHPAPWFEPIRRRILQTWPGW